ncbi:MAG: DUF1109 family protein [Rhodospirillales bacterium]|nr:DUF1109 family protein [Rhodospirillales bacterium]
MMQTDELITRLGEDLVAVRRAAPPWRRAALWLAPSAAAGAAVALGFGLRADLAQRLADPRFVLETGLALLTAIAAAWAAFCAGRPDEPAWKLWLPMLPLALWLATLGQPCLLILVTRGPAGLVVTQDAMCLPAIAAGGLVPAVAITALLRRVTPFRRGHASFCGALAAAALGACALRFYHTQDAAIMVLIWQLGSVAILTAAGSWIGRHLLPALRVTFPGAGA